MYEPNFILMNIYRTVIKWHLYIVINIPCLALMMIMNEIRIKIENKRLPNKYKLEI